MKQQVKLVLAKHLKNGLEPNASSVCIMFTQLQFLLALRMCLDLFNSLLHWLAVVSNELYLVSCSLDKLLDSGLYTGEITELSGGPGSGKSQVNISYLPSSSLIISVSKIPSF